MKFRFVLLNPDEDPEGRLPTQEISSVRKHIPPSGIRYEQRGMGITGIKSLKSGRSKSWDVTNFGARIVRDLILDDGVDHGRKFEVEVTLNEKTLTAVLSTAEFVRMSWVLNKLGPEAIVYPGQQQHARAAIQSLSGAVRQERVFSHLGWRKCGAQWVYLHAGGAVGPEGYVGGLNVTLPAALQSYRFLPAEDSSATARAVRSSFDLLGLAPDRISIPLLAGVYRAALGSVDFSMFVVGKTGVFKTALAALCQQHFGATMDAHHLPSSFASTASALEEPAFCAKDAVLVVDDFAPTGRYRDSELQNVAERLFRAVGNGQGRTRMGSNTRPGASKPPRALVMATGEQVPEGHSIRARLLIVDVGPGDISRPILSECQRYGQQGLLATSMSSFLQWVARRYDELQCRLRTRTLEIRGQMNPNSAHARLPGALAELQAGWEIFTEFALEVGAIDCNAERRLQERCRGALRTLGVFQAKYQDDNDPALRFISLLQTALACERAHVADRYGRSPNDASIWGWHRLTSGRKWTPRGTRIGWLSGTELFLDPATSYRVARESCGTERFTESEQALRHQLRERGLLASVDQGRGMVQVRRTLEGIARQVLHLKARDLVRPEPINKFP
jgi:hypothetical protein